MSMMARDNNAEAFHWMCRSCGTKN